MKISSLSVKNYRNLDSLSLTLANDINFIVGENNIGKSNLLCLIDSVLSAKSFNEKDFADINLPIEVEVSLFLNDEEIGLFDDLCDPQNISNINIIAKQDNPDEFIKFFHKETNVPISNVMIKSLNSIKYDSLRNPKSEIDFSKSKGAAALLNYLVEAYLTQASSEDMYLVKDNLNKLNTYISDILNNIICFKRFNITPTIEEDTLNMLSKLIVLKDKNGINLQDTGYGVQFNLLILLSIFDKIVKQYKEDKANEEKEFSCILLFDEPEIHFNPFLQRTLINEIYNISNGQDICFNNIIKQLFRISKFEAQIIISTHSRDILLNDYEKILRMGYHNNKIEIVSGCKLNISDTHKKHLFMHFPFVKEAMFSQKVLIVEGESEYGALDKFAKKLKIDFDNDGICIINAGSAYSVIPLIELFQKFNIDAVGIVDRDVLDGSERAKLFENRTDLFFTQTKCFESEIVEDIFYNKPNLLEKILVRYDSQGKERTFQANIINKTINKFEYKSIPTVSKEYKFSELSSSNELLKILYITWFSLNKGIILGGIIGDELDDTDIPQCYQLAIKKIKGSQEPIK